jgi:D-sedoheptulose 7-phosphate isomerase
MISTIKTYIRELLDELDILDEASVSGVADVLWSCYSERRRLVVCGNGGSASTASHFATDLQKGLVLTSQDNAPWEVLSICDSIPLMTAWSNDTDFSNVFAAQAKCWLRRGDVLLVISGSGNSKNILAAVDAAHAIGATTVALCGFGGGRLALKAKHSIILTSTNMQQIEDVHMVIAHALFCALRDRISLVQVPLITVDPVPIEVLG